MEHPNTSGFNINNDRSRTSNSNYNYYNQTLTTMDNPKALVINTQTDKITEKRKKTNSKKI